MVCKVKAKKRDAIFDRDSGECQYCGDFAAVVDHIIPRVAGGSNDDDNLKSACQPCNNAAIDWVFSSWEEKKRYVLLRRFGHRRDWEQFRDSVGRFQARWLDSKPNALRGPKRPSQRARAWS